MSDTIASSLPFYDSSSDQDEGATETHDQTTNPKGQQPVEWQVIVKTNGLMEAQVMAGRLQSEGIPARAWAESAGQAIGISIGLLGTGFLAVPEPFVEQALGILRDPVEGNDDFYEEE